MNLGTSLKKWFETSTQKQKLTAVLLGFSLLSTVALLMMKSASGATDDSLGSSPFYFVGVFAKLIGVLLLIVVSSIIFRRWFQPGSNRKTSRQLRVLETVRLSPKQALHLISIGDQQLLVGATDQSLSLITHVEQSFDTEPVETTTPQASLDFGTVLHSFDFRSPAGASK